LYIRLLAAEPHAIAARKHELRIEATRQTRQGSLFFDLTLSLSKSISIFHAVPVSYNSAQFLGRLPGRRGARSPMETSQRPLLLVDEASTMSGPDLADLIAYAQDHDGKVILAGTPVSCRPSRTAAACPCSPVCHRLSHIPDRPRPRSWPAQSYARGTAGYAR
jgi:hypothetical protein